MADYQHILLAVDYSEHCYHVADKARHIAQQYQAQLTLMHVLDNIPMPDTQYGAVLPVDKHSDNELLEVEKAKLLKLGKKLEIDREQCFLVWGLPKREITVFAEHHGIDLIVVGSHGRHGLALLLGSTANAVLHHAKCDVLSVRLRD